MALSIIISSLLLSMFFFAFTAQPAKAQSEIIYINPDGSISSPVPANITTHDNVMYTFTGNNYLPVQVQRNNITIDGAGYMLSGSGSGVGIYLSATFYVTIKNTSIANFWYGLSLNSSSHDTISGNNITTNDVYGVYLDSSSNNSISGNNIANNVGGIGLYYSSSNSVSGNTFTDDGLFVWDSFGNSVKSNTVNGKPLVYLEGVAGYSVGDAGQVVLVECDGIRVENLNLSSASVGVQLWGTNSSTISRDNTTANEYYGIGLYYSSSNSVSGNNVANDDDAIFLDVSSNNSISGNNIADDSVGVYICYSSNNSVSGNSITGKITVEVWPYGVYISSSSNNNVSGNSIAGNYQGVYIYYSSNSSICGNSIANNHDGVVLDTDSSNSSISGNIIANNGVGVDLDYLGSSIFHNDFLNNTQQVVSLSNGTWDSGYPSGGNYWSDYQTRYPTAAEIDSSGIWNEGYVIDSNNIDHYPLVGPTMPLTWEFQAYPNNMVQVYSNSSISSFEFNATEKSISLNVAGKAGTSGFCDIAIPKSLIWGTITVTKDGIPLVNGTGYIQTENSTFYFIHMTYTHSTHTFVIKGTEAMPEFQPFMLLPLFMIITLLGAVVIKRKRNVKR